MNIFEAKRILRKNGYRLLSETAPEYENDIYTDELEGGDPADTEEQDISSKYGTAMHIEEPEDDEDEEEESVEVETEEEMTFDEAEHLLQTLKTRCDMFNYDVAKDMVYMLDDGSSDGSWDISEDIYKRYDEIKEYYSTDDLAKIFAEDYLPGNAGTAMTVFVKYGRGSYKAKSRLIIDIPYIMTNKYGPIIPASREILRKLNEYGDKQTRKPQVERTGYMKLDYGDYYKNYVNGIEIGDKSWDNQYLRAIHDLIVTDGQELLQNIIDKATEKYNTGNGLDIDGPDEEMTDQFSDKADDLYTDFEQHMEDDYDEYVDIDEED